MSWIRSAANWSIIGWPAALNLAYMSFFELATNTVWPKGACHRSNRKLAKSCNSSRDVYSFWFDEFPSSLVAKGMGTDGKLPRTSQKTLVQPNRSNRCANSAAEAGESILLLLLASSFCYCGVSTLSSTNRSSKYSTCLWMESVSLKKAAVAVGTWKLVY